MVHIWFKNSRAKARGESIPGAGVMPDPAEDTSGQMYQKNQLFVKLNQLTMKVMIMELKDLTEIIDPVLQKINQKF